MWSILLNRYIKLIIFFLVFATPVFAQQERIGGFNEEKDLVILNEELRKIWDRLFRVKSNEDDDSPTYLDSAQLSVIKDKDGDTKVDTEESTDEDIIRMDAAGTEIATADVDQFAVKSGIKLGLEGCSGDSYFVYNETSDYVELWVNGVKRAEF